MAVAVLICFAVFLYLCFVYLKPRRNRLPIGPRGIPVFGNVLQFETKRFGIGVAEVGRKFGDACTIRLFQTDYVMFNSFDMVKEALTTQKYAVAFSGRPENFTGKYVLKDGLTMSKYSETFSSFRRLILRGLKTYGTNTPEVEELTQGEIRHLLDRIQKEAGTSVNPYVYISGYVTSVISMLITGRHLKQEDAQLKLLSKIVEQMDYLFDPGRAQILTSLPWLRHIPIGLGKVYQQLWIDMHRLEKQITQDRMRPCSETNRKPCLMDFILEEREKGNVSGDQVRGVMLDLLSGGTATSRATTYSLFLALSSKPDIQKKIQQEIEDVVGRSRLPCSSDKTSMPYTQAVLWESFRLYPAASLTFPHYTMEDVNIRDYLIPKDTPVFYNVWLILHDEKFWENPWEFNPSRFLDKDGNLLPPEHEKRQRMIAFGVGKRSCIGETVARHRIFLALTSVLQRFTLIPDPKQPLPDTDPRTFESKALLMAPTYNIIFKSRQ